MEPEARFRSLWHGLPGCASFTGRIPVPQGISSTGWSGIVLRDLADPLRTIAFPGTSRLNRRANEPSANVSIHSHRVLPIDLCQILQKSLAHPALKWISIRLALHLAGTP